MKIRKILAITFAAIALVSCKNESKTEDTSMEEGKLPETISVTFNVTVPKDDTFHLLYTEDETLNFSGEKSIAAVVKGGEQPQDVIFKLPVDAFPTNIRLDLGENKEQGEMSVNAMKVNYLTKHFEHSGDIVKTWFYHNDSQLSYDEKTGKVKAVVGKDGRHVPLIWSNEFIRDEFIKLSKGTK